MSLIENKISDMFELLRGESKIRGVMDFVEQITWLFFLKFFDDFDLKKGSCLELFDGDDFMLFDQGYQWSNWACPKSCEGELNVKNIRSENELIDYVNNRLFPYLKTLSGDVVFSEGNEVFTLKVGDIFQCLDNKITSGWKLREVLNMVDSLNFKSNSDLLSLSYVYEGLLKNMVGAAGNAGEFYTSRALVRTMIKVLDPKAGQTIYDPAVGTGGFLVEAFEYLKVKNKELSIEQLNLTVRDAFVGVEKTSPAYVFGLMNMILHGIKWPKLYLDNTLTKSIDGDDKYCFDMVLSNPPFGGKETIETQLNFPIQSSATELLFLQHVMKCLKSGGKAAVIVPEGFLFQASKAHLQVKRYLLDNFNLHAILSLPAGVFLPYAGIKTSVLFFEKSGSTRDVWYYECLPEQRLTKNNPITEDHLENFVQLYKSRKITDCSWRVSASELMEECNLSARNPAKIVAKAKPKPHEILNKIKENERKVESCLAMISSQLSSEEMKVSEKWPIVKLHELITLHLGKRLIARDRVQGSIPIYGAAGVVGYHNVALRNKPTVTIGCKGQIGKVNLCMKNSWINDSAYYVKILDPKILNIEYFYYFVSNVDVSKLLRGATMPVFRKEDYLNLVMPLPVIEEQDRIVELLRNIYEKIELNSKMYEANIESLSLLKATILDGLHTGSP